jgi:nitrite reductase/ring-hydroxylating ferredoxin subunit
MSSTTTATTTDDTSDAFEGLAARVDAAIAALGGLEPAAREKAEAVKEAIEAFHKAGLTAIVRALKADPRGKELLFALVDDPTVHALLALHGIIRQPPREEPAAAPQPIELVQIQLPGARPPEPAWIEGPAAESITAEKPACFAAGEARVIVIRSLGGLRAFRNACAHVGLPLDRGVCDVDAGTITCPWHGFRFDSESGECLTAPQCQLEPFPLRVTDGIVWVRPS